MGRIVIACYQPKPGKAAALRALAKEHVSILRSAGLVTERIPIVMEAADGTIVEVFEWQSPEAIQSAHTHPVVQRLWERYAAVCDYVPIGAVPEASKLFSEFTPLEL